MLRWDFNEKIGTLVIKQTRDKDYYYTLHLYRGNALMIMLWEWKENGKDMYNMFCFIADKKHLDNIVKNSPEFFSEWKVITIDRKYYKTSELNAIVNGITKCNPECTIILK